MDKASEAGLSVSDFLVNLRIVQEINKIEKKNLKIIFQNLERKQFTFS